MSAGAGLDFALKSLHLPRTVTFYNKRFEPLRRMARESLLMDKLVNLNCIKAAERKEDIRGVNAEQERTHTELSIVDNSNKLVYLTPRISALSSTKLHFIFRALLIRTNHALILVHLEFPETTQKNYIALFQGFWIRILYEK